MRGFAQTLLMLLREPDVTHVGCAFDHVVESFRNDMFAGHKTGEGVPEELMAQFGLAEQATGALGVVVWPMVEFEADDAMATAAARWRDAEGVDQVVICSPDKDLTQMVQGDRVVCLDRRRGTTLDEAGVVAKFGVAPESIPDYLALVGDSADGIPGVPRWGAKSSSVMLSHYRHLESIPDDPAEWDVSPRGAAAMAGQPGRETRRRPALPPPRHAAPGRAAGREPRGPALARSAAGRVQGAVRRAGLRGAGGAAAPVAHDVRVALRSGTWRFDGPAGRC